MEYYEAYGKWLWQYLGTILKGVAKIELKSILRTTEISRHWNPPWNVKEDSPSTIHIIIESLENERDFHYCSKMFLPFLVSVFFSPYVFVSSFFHLLLRVK